MWKIQIEDYTTENVEPEHVSAITNVHSIEFLSTLAPYPVIYSIEVFVDDMSSSDFTPAPFAVIYFFAADGTIGQGPSALIALIRRMRIVSKSEEQWIVQSIAAVAAPSLGHLAQTVAS